MIEQRGAPFDPANCRSSLVQTGDKRKSPLSQTLAMWLPPVLPRRQLFVLKYILYFLSIAGLFSLPSDRNPPLYEILYNFYFLLVMSGTIMVTIFTAADLLDHLNDVDVLADHGVIFAALLVMLIKQNSLVRHKRLIEVWVAEVQRRYLAASETGKIRLSANDEKTFYHMKIFLCIWILITASYLLPLYLGRPDKFELPTVNAAFFRVDSILKYVFVYAWNTAALSLAILGVFAADFFMVGMYNEATSRLKALADALENIACDDVRCNERGSVERSDRRSSSIRHIVRKSVAEHNDVIKLIGELNHVFYWTLLVQSVFVAVIVAGCGFYGLVSMLHGNIPSFVKSMMYISGVICENWLYCTYGDRLKSASLNVAEALWKSNWYTLAKEERMSVLLIMRASENPLLMSAGKIFLMDLERLGFILSSAYSYFTVLRNFA